MNIGKWNYETKVYDPYTIPDGAKIAIYSENMKLKINCTSCFKDMTFGDGYTSKVLHTAAGFGYPVCENCYHHETVEEQKHRD